MVAVCTIELFIPAAASLKDKRHVVKSVLDRLRGRLHAAAAETGAQDTWQRAVLTVALVSGDAGVLSRQVEQVRRLVEDLPEAAVAGFDTQFV